MGEETKDTQVAEDTKESGVQANEVEKEEKETQKTFTQQEVDKIVKERLERERKASKPKEKAREDSEAKEASSDKESELLSEMKAMHIENLALKNGVDSKHLDYIMKLIDLEEGSIKERFDKVMEAFPFFKEKEESEVGKAVKASVTKANPAKKTMTKAEIMAIENREERRKAIRENSHLFNI